MTHDELLARMNLYTVCDRPTKPGMVCDNEHLRESYPEWFALRAVVELHYQQNEDGYCEQCVDFNYPCRTIQAIEKELK